MSRGRQPSPTTRNEPEGQPRLAHQSSKQVFSQLGMVVRRPEQYPGACRLLSRNPSATVRHDHVAQAFTELVAGGFFHFDQSSRAVPKRPL